jgi:SOS-response transcriptional repressor LexA/DNA-binding transcriptional regulator YiaG
MNTSLSKVRTAAYAGSHIGDHIADPKNGKTMRKLQRKSGTPPAQDWATTIFKMRQRLNLNQIAFGQRLYSSAMSVSRWERGTQEPTAESYIALGNFAGTPLCWYFWGRAGLQTEDLKRVMPKHAERFSQTSTVVLRSAIAGSGSKIPMAPQLVAIPLLEVVAASHGERGDNSAILHDAPVESMIAAPKDWCPNPSATTCLRVRGKSMMPLITDGCILVVDSSQKDSTKLNGKIVIAWHRDMGLTVSRLQHYDHTDVLQPESRGYDSIVLNSKHKWKIVAKVLWWIEKAP